MSELHYPLKALDVSSYQGRVDWSKVAGAGFKLSAIKATEGTSFVDPNVKRNVEHARDAGIHVALYHYAHPSESPRREARHFLDVALPLVKVGDPCPCLDLEVAEGLSPDELWRWQHTFSTMVEEALGGHVVFYSYRAFLAGSINFPPHHRPIWGADYGHVPKRVLDGWHAWQYTSAGTVPGISGPCDLDSILKPLPVIGRKPK